MNKKNLKVFQYLLKNCLFIFDYTFFPITERKSLMADTKSELISLCFNLLNAFKTQVFLSVFSFKLENESMFLMPRT